MGHMNVMWYVGKFDEATWNLFARLGINREYLSQNKRAMVAVQQNITYKRELFAGDCVYVRSRMLEIRAKVIRFSHEMVNGTSEEIAATTEITGVHIESEIRKSVPLPEEIAKKARDLLSEPKSR
jgi:acyl-CoA thioester hydrolase